MPDVGTAYVQILPKAKGIKANIEKSMRGDAVAAGESTGAAMGSSLVGSLGKMVAAAGIGKMVQSAISEGANLQQSFGGLDTLYGDAAAQAKSFAYEAAQAGISANDYAEQAVSFGAALKQAYGGDTTKAVKAANTAILDMADNAAKMGTPLESIQAAYQGFARGQYQLLDNLKLGYGGTKEEMQRLLSDAEALTGVKYDINNLGDVYSAISAIQENLGLSGVAAAEAAETISGSFGAVKANLSNVFANLALGESIGPSLQSLLESVDNFVFDNLLPAFGNIVSGLPEVFAGIVDFAPQILESVQGLIDPIIQTITETDWLGTISGIVTSITTAITENLPTFLENGVQMITELANGMLQSAPEVIARIGEILTQLVTFLLSNAPTLMQNGFQLIANLASGIGQNLPAILSAIGNVLEQLISAIAQRAPALLSQGVSLIGQMASGLAQNLPAVLGAIASVIAGLLARLGQALPGMLQQGIALIGQLAAGIIQSVPRVVGAIPGIISGIRSAFSGFNWASIGSNIISGIASGISAAAGSIISSMQSLASNALSAAKSALGISSPSKVFAREVGQYIPQGIAMGIEQEDAPVVAINRQVNAMVDAGRLAQNVGAVPAGNSYDYGGVTINVYAAQGQSVEEIANEVSRRINNQINRRRAVWA